VCWLSAQGEQISEEKKKIFLTLHALFWNAFSHDWKLDVYREIYLTGCHELFSEMVAFK
jgi:hypothetical protein